MTPTELSKLTPEEKRERLARAHGWKTKPATVCGAPGFVAVSPSGQSFWNEASCVESAALIRVCPDYLNDLNAMHEAEKVLTEKRKEYYIQWLLGERTEHTQDHYVGYIERPAEDFADLAFATATQRANAFLLCLDAAKGGK